MTIRRPTFSPHSGVKVFVFMKTLFPYMNWLVYSYNEYVYLLLELVSLKSFDDFVVAQLLVRNIKPKFPRTYMSTIFFSFEHTLYLYSVSDCANFFRTHLSHVLQYLLLILNVVKTYLNCSRLVLTNNVTNVNFTRRRSNLTIFDFFSTMVSTREELLERKKRITKRCPTNVDI